MQLQVVQKDEFARRAKKQQERTVELAPSRGAVLDVQGKPLAVSVLADSVFAIPSDVENPRRTSLALASLLGLPAREIERKLSNLDRDFVWLARRVPEETAAKLRARPLPGVRLTKEPARRYPEGSLAASVLGYVGMDNQGLGGLEHRYDGVIRGQPVRVTFFRDAAQRQYATRSGARADAAGTEGSTLV
ncbi:MAG TPA: penicillin-binding protein, partial [Thermoanaerobaculia bacterium]|nr:penicillin-binding protein [Thermoanaerobaculia bacterium]